MKCPYCGSQNITRINNALVCETCGSVIEENIVAETAYYNASSRELHAKPRPITPKAESPEKKNALMSRYRKLVDKAYSLIEEAARQLGFEEHTGNIKFLARTIITAKITDADPVTSKNLPKYVASIILVYTKTNGIPVPYKKLKKLVGLNRGSALRETKEVKELLGINTLDRKTKMKIASRMLAKLPANGVNTVRVKQKLRKFIEETEGSWIWATGHAKMIIAAAIYLAVNTGEGKISVQEVSRLYGVSDNALHRKIKTIRDVFTETVGGTLRIKSTLLLTG